MVLTKVRQAGADSGPASVSAIQRAKAAVGLIPEQLMELWTLCDGLYLENGAKVYSTEEIGERNATFQLEENATQYLLIGDNSGGRGLLLLRQGQSELFACDLGFLDADYFHVIADDFASWIAGGCESVD